MSFSCPNCQHRLTVISTNPVSKGVRRFLRCDHCGHKATSLEEVYVKPKPAKSQMEVTGMRVVGIKHVDSGTVYATVVDAAKALHLSESAIIQAVGKGTNTTVGRFTKIIEFLDM